MSLLLLSGGMDSTALAFWKRPQAALTIDYGQVPADAERDASHMVCEALDIPHHHLTVDCSSLGSGDLAGTAPSKLAPCSEWWPFRNQLLITLAAMKAVQLNLNSIVVGVVASDSVHVDGSAGFLEHMNMLVRLQEGGLTIAAPAAGLTPVELIHASGVPPEILGWAHSCHVSNLACGQCRGCLKHFDTWKQLGWPAH